MDPISTGILSSATYDALKKGKDFVEPVFWGFMVETVDELSEKYPGVKENIIKEFFFDEEIAEQIEEYRSKAEPIDFEKFVKTFSKICKHHQLTIDPREILRDFFDYLESKIASKPKLREKLEFYYLQDIRRNAEKIKKEVKKIDTVIQGQEELKESFSQFQKQVKTHELKLESKPKYYRGDTQYFTGREHDIEELISIIQTSDKPIAIVGEGGLGKTSLAIKSIKKCEEKFDLIIPLYFDQRYTFYSFLNEFSARLNINQSEFVKKTEQQKIEVLMSEIMKRKKVLIFADNYEAVLVKIQDSSPDEDKIKINNFLENIPTNIIILLTSRLKHNLPNEKIIELEGLLIEDGISLFKTLAESNLKGKANEQISNKIKQIVERVGEHPLAIELLSRSYGGNGVDELDKMIESLGVKETNPKSSESRLRSLKSCFDYSIKFLDEKLKKLFFDLTICKSPFPSKIFTNFFNCSENDLEKLHNHSLIRRIEKDEFGDLEKEYWLYDFHPVIRAYLENELNEKKLDSHLEYNQKLGIFYGQFLSDIRDEISSEKRGYILRQFRIMAGTIPNDIDFFADLTEKKNVQAQIYGLTALLSHYAGFFENALIYYQKILSIFPLNAFPENLIPILGNYSNLLSSMGDFNEAIELQKETAKFFEKKGNKGDVGIAYDNIGFMLYRSGRPLDGKLYLEKAIEMLQNSNYRDSLATAYLNLGNVFRELEDIDESLNFLEKATNIFKELSYPEKLSICYNDIGITYSNKKDHNKALEFLKKSIEIAEKLNDERLIAKADLNFGIVYTRKRDLINAEIHLKKALLVFKKFNEVVRLIDCNYRLGDVCFFKHDLKNAMNYHQIGFSLARKIGDKNNISRLAVTIASTFAAGGYFKESIEYIKFTVPILKERNYHDRLKSCKDILKIIIEATSKKDKTESNSKDAKNLLDHINEETLH